MAKLPGIFCDAALLAEGWASDVSIVFDKTGTISSIQTGAKPGALPCMTGPVIPGMPNLHSHAFQRAMAGLTQRVGPNDDSFWTWRNTMYGFVEQLQPEAIHAIAAQLYVDLLKNGYTAIGEFHYLHHDPTGKPYAQRAELSHRVIAAALETGIGITHLPVLYRYGGFGNAPAATGQRRFINDSAGFAEILTDLSSCYSSNPQVRIGIAPHSLRAVSPELLSDAIELLNELDKTAPIHIHIAEQHKEVDDCLRWSGQRPVQWLLENQDLSPRWCLVHATHMTAEETEALARSGAVAGLCPTTEADLGDGIFPAVEFLSDKGRFGIGSDSHVCVSPTEELRLLEYGQRLMKYQRNLLHCGGAAVGAGLYKTALAGGAQALGRKIGRIAVGFRADLVILDSEQPLLYGREADTFLDSYVFSGGQEMVSDVIVGGEHIVAEGRHRDEEKITSRYRKTIQTLTH